MKANYTIHNFAKQLVMVLAVGLMAVNAWGATVAKWDYSSDGLSNTVKGQITVSYAQNNGTNPVAISSSLLRLYRQNASPYNGCSATFTASSGYQITAIKVKFSGGRTSARGKIDNGSYQDVFSGGNSATVTISSLTATSYSIQNQASGSTTVTIDSIMVTYESTCDKKVTVSNGGSSTNGSITSITTSPVATCSSTASDRRVSILVTPSTGYVAPTDLTVASSTGTVSATKISRTDNGNGTFTFVYQFAQNNNGTITYNAACVGKQCTVTFDKNSGTGGDNSVTATYGSAMTAIDPPTREHFDFGGYYDSETDNDGTGNKYYNADGSSAATWNKNTTAATTLYAKWTEHSLTNYRTVCCTELGTIDGEASLTQAGNSVTISGWSDVSNVGTYTVKLYKKNGASWDLVSGTTSGGSAGTQGTRTGITSGSKSVTYTGLEVESEYKFTVQAIAGSSAYCDGVETAVTEINDVDVSSTPFKFRYSIYIDNGSNSGWAHHYITPTGNTDEGSVDIDLSAHVDYYQFKIAGGFSGWWGQGTPQSKIPANTQWTLNGAENVWLNTGAGGSYTFTVDYSSTNPAVTVTFPSADQDAGYVIYYDNSVLNWSSLYYRVGNNSSCSKVDVSLVPGTDKFYKVTTPDFDNMDAWHIANNYGWTGSNSIYRTKTNSDPAEAPKAITNSIAFQQYAVTEDITVIPTTTHSTGTDTGDAGNSNCEFYTINTPTSGMLTHNAAITLYSHGTVTVAYTNTSGSAASFTSGNADLAHRCVLTITATPATGYSLSSLQVNSSDFTSGNEHILSADATITAVFTAQTSTVTLQATSATTGSDQTVLATYDASMPLVTTADKTPAVAAISRTGYTFNGWWDATSSGKQYYSHSAGTIASANNWDKTGSQTLYAQWIAKEYTITLDREGGSTGAESATATFDSGTLTGWSAPSKTGYTFGGYYSGDNGTGTLVISTAGVLQNSVTISAVNWTDASGHWIKDGGVTLYAKWTADEYTISYKDEGNVAYSGSNSALLPTTHTYGAATDLVDGVKSGYRFDGWFDNSSCTGSAITTIGATAITANTTYYAKWTEVYTVTWHVNGEEYSTGVVTGNSQVPDGEKISDVPTAPADNTLNNCANKFMGWSAKDAGSTAKTTSYYDDLFTDVAGSPEITANTTFYAVFAEEVNSGTYSDGTTHQWLGSSGYSDWGGTATYSWLRNNNATIPTHYYTPAYGVKKVVLNVKQSTTTGSNTVAVTIGGTTVGTTQGMGSGTSAFDMTFDHGTGTPLTGEVRIVATNTSANTTGQGTFYLNSITLYEGTPDKEFVNYVTECAANQVRVSYNFNGGYGSACSEGVTTKTASYTVCSTTPTKNFYDFTGWNDGTSTYAAGATGYNLQANTTFTAQWTPTTYNITYELDGGTNSGSNPATYNVTTATITLQNPTKGHDRFEGWYSTYSAGVYSDPVTEITLGSHGNITLYAKWTERHEIVFDYTESASSGTTTIYRADDENLEDAVAGMGSVPDDPDAPSACSSKVFVGWSESTIDDETNTRPGDLIDATGTVSGDKHYYAVWATSTSGSKTLVMEITRADFDGSYHDGAEQSHTSTAVANDGSGATLSVSWKSVNVGDFSSKIQVKDASGAGFWNTTDLGSISSVSITTGNNITHYENTSVHPTSTSGTTKGYFTITKSGGTGTATKVTVTFTKTVSYYIAYSTSCCATNVTLSQNSPEHGTIAFGKTKVPTCGGDKEVSLTITPAAGYQLHSYEVATGSGKVATKSVSPAIALDNNSSAVQNITLTFAEDANGAYDVTAAFSLMTVTSWTWTMHEGGGAIPNPLELYVGQSARLDVAYTPEGVVSGKKTYTREKNDTYINWVGAQQSAYSTISGRTSTGANTTPVIFTHTDGPTKTVNVKVLPLPLTHFEDLVHGKAFADVAATIVDNALSATKTTPTSDDWTTPNANDCESDHLHLVGWIREDWPALVTYLNGGAQPTTTAIVGAGNDGSGNAYFIVAGASINVQTFDGVTFYAVWAQIE